MQKEKEKTLTETSTNPKCKKSQLKIIANKKQ